MNKTKPDKSEIQAHTILDIAFKMSRQYRACFPPVAWQFSKVFNRGMGALAFMRAVPEDKALLVNKGLLNNRERTRFVNLLKVFPGWKLVEVSLGYPEWYNVRDLYYVYKKED